MHTLSKTVWKRWMHYNAFNKNHIYANETSKNFINRFKNPEKCDIQMIVGKSRKIKAQNNRKILISLLDIIFLLGEQNIAFRGHREGDINLIFDPEHNEGNFRAIIKFSIEKGDKILENH